MLEPVLLGSEVGLIECAFESIVSVYLLPFSGYLDRDGLCRGTDGEGLSLFAGIRGVVVGAVCWYHVLCVGGLWRPLGLGYWWRRVLEGCAEWVLGVVVAGVRLSMVVIWSVGSAS